MPLPRNIRLTIGITRELHKPFGCLPWDSQGSDLGRATRGSAGLWFYYTRVSMALDQETEGVKYEGEADNERDYYQLFKAAAEAHGVEPNYMVNFWPEIDQQASLMGFPILQKHRQGGKPALKVSASILGADGKPMMH